MARNIEIKARIERVDALTMKVAKLTDWEPIYLSQGDTFFKCNSGCLKRLKNEYFISSIKPVDTSDIVEGWRHF
jgi:adenylate cyclase class IV